MSAMIEAGHLTLPADAHWLPEFKTEVLGFPNARHDDVVDALSQLGIWVAERASQPIEMLAGPILFEPNDDGSYWETSEHGRHLKWEDDDPICDPFL